jgi:uncharacterized BrkB/YihY/UPF0761 family membrane protein
VTVEPRPTDPQLVRYVRSYLIMRVVVGALGVALPVLLVFGDERLGGTPVPRDSLSAYYYSGARELFVGVLAAIAVFLVCYRVAERSWDNGLSLLAGGAVLTVAVFRPDRRRSSTSQHRFRAHSAYSWCRRSTSPQRACSSHRLG